MSLLLLLLLISPFFSKQCEQKIEKKSLRIGKKIIVRHRESFMYFHWECFFLKFSADEGVGEWKGFDRLEEEDQEKLKEKIANSKTSKYYYGPSII